MLQTDGQMFAIFASNNAICAKQLLGNVVKTKNYNRVGEWHIRTVVACVKLQTLLTVFRCPCTVSPYTVLSLFTSADTALQYSTVHAALKCRLDDLSRQVHIVYS